MKRIYIGLILVMAALACRQPYNPPVVSSKKAFLVVEANLNPQGPTTISLTRTSPLAAGNVIKGENNAQVTVEGKDNSVRVLGALGNGRYTSANLALILGNEYRLRIKTADGKEYVSVYMKAKKTPAIDSIGYDFEDKGLRIYANTKDVSKATRYYRWDYDETWEIHTAYGSGYIYDPALKDVRRRVFPAEDYSTCWKYGSSTTIILANSTRLADDIIYKAPINLIPNGSEKLAVRYSILLRQYALDKEANDFFELMKKNTEEIGNIFAPQPSEVRGNITCTTDPAEYVLGYVTTSTVEEKRQFITIRWRFDQDCPSIKVPNNPDSIKAYFASGSLIPYDFSLIPPPAYYGSYPPCVDCRVRGGSLIRPSYW